MWLQKKGGTIMTDSAKLDLLLSEMQEMKQDIHLLKDDTRTLKSDMQELKDVTRELKGDTEKLKEDTEQLKVDTEQLKVVTQALSQKTDTIESKVIRTELILENEIRVNIQRVAEGHLDLSRSLHDAMRLSNEVEMLSIKVRMPESDVKDLKSRFA